VERSRISTSYNVQILSNKLEKTMDENFEMKMEIEAMKAENDIVNCRV
jgi:hypothetical protein